MSADAAAGGSTPTRLIADVCRKMLQLLTYADVCRKMLQLGLHPDTPDAEAQQALKNANRFLTRYNLSQAPLTISRSLALSLSRSLALSLSRSLARLLAR